ARSSALSASKSMSIASMSSTAAAQIGSAAVGKARSSSRSGGSYGWSAKAVHPRIAPQKATFATSTTSWTLPARESRRRGGGAGWVAGTAPWWPGSAVDRHLDRRRRRRRRGRGRGRADLEGDDAAGGERGAGARRLGEHEPRLVAGRARHDRDPQPERLERGG